jgi:hypothetical protein
MNVFIFNDNLVSDAMFCKGSSTNQELYEMVLEVYTETSAYYPNKNDQARNIWAIPRGIPTGRDHRRDGKHGPLHLDPLERSPALRPCLVSWLGVEPDVCTPKDWFYRRHMPGTKVWLLAPEADLDALEELGIVRLKRAEEISARVIVLALLRPESFRQFIKTVDFHFVIPVGTPSWPASMHESLIVGLSLPFPRSKPCE